MCTSPNYMVWLGEYHPGSGKEKFHFQPHCNFDKLLKAKVPFIEVPCGNCLECKQQHASMWSDRCVFEAMQYEHNYFITLTYDDVHVPLDGCLNQKHMQDFIKRLRITFKRKYNQENIRYYYVGEYGQNLRCHFHIILFNIEIPDLTDVFELKEADGRYHKHKRPSSTSLYSRIIYDLWENKGMITIDEFNYNTAAYVAGYVNKKVDPVHTALLKKFNLTPEFHRMSTNPGIGANYFNPEMFDKKFLIVPRSGGAKHSIVPRYYEKILDKEYPWLFNELKDEQAFNRYLRLLEYENSSDHKDDINAIRAARAQAKNKVRQKI